MAKSKKSKILAMALCASVMTGIYAAPVMADNVNASFDSSSGNIVFKIAGDTYTIKKDDITNAIARNPIHSNGQISANGGFIARGCNYAIVGNTQYAMLANKDYFALGDDLRMNAQDNEKRASFYVDNATGNVTTKGDVTTLNDDGTVNYSLNTIGANTAGIERIQNGAGNNITEIEGTLRIYENGTISTANSKFKINNQGTVFANAVNVADNAVVISENSINAFKGNFTVNTNGGVSTTGINVAKGMFTASAGGVTMAEGATSFTKDGMTTNGLSVKGTYGGFHVENVTNSETRESNTMIYTTDQNGDRTLSIDPNTGNLVTPGSLNVAGGRFVVDKDTGNMAVNAADGKAVFQVNGNDGTVHVGKVGGAQTVITGNSITTETLNVENIKLGNSMTDKDGNTITIGAAGVIDIEKDGNTVFHADTDNFEAHYDNYDLTLDGTNGFVLSNQTTNQTSSFTLNGNGFAFAGPVHLGNGTQVKFSHNGTDISLSSLVNRVENLEQKTQGISFDETTGSTTIADKVGTDGVESNNSMTVGNNGTTFENGTDSKTNINGGAIDADSSSIGNDVSGGSGSGSSGMTGNGTYTNGSEHSGHFVDKDSSYKFTNDANGFTGTVTDGKHTTTIENGAMGSNTTVKGDNASASSGVGIGNDGAFISDSVTNGDISHTVNGGSITDTVTNGDMTVTEVKDENGSATTVKDANGSSTVSQDRNGQTVSTGTGTSVNTGNDFSVTDNETGKSIYMSDIGHVEDIDSEIQNSDGSKTTVVDAVNNEAEIRRNEIERVDGRINNLENRVGELEDRIDKVGAMAAAIANLRTMGYDPAAPTEVAVGIGQYRDETGAALGLFHYPNRDFMLSLSVSTSGDEVMGGIGATWKFGRKSPEKVAEIKKAQAEADARRAEEAKLAKAEEMKQAAKEAKIKAQQERHAKLAAERAAQAEAAK